MVKERAINWKTVFWRVASPVHLLSAFPPKAVKLDSWWFMLLKGADAYS